MSGIRDSEQYSSFPKIINASLTNQEAAGCKLGQLPSNIDATWNLLSVSDDIRGLSGRLASTHCIQIPFPAAVVECEARIPGYLERYGRTDELNLPSQPFQDSRDAAKAVMAVFVAAGEP